MINDLTETEVRVLGALIEKELTTPDQYPLSLNAIVLACNQKSNREPVMSLGEGAVLDAIDSLSSRHLVREKNQSGTRVTKYVHRLGGGLNVGYDLDREQLGVLAVLLLRGPQTPGELRARTGRLCDVRAPGAVESTLEKLAGATQGPFVVRQPRQPGRKEARYAHLLAGEPAEAAHAHDEARPDHDPAQASEALEDRVAALERAVEALTARLTGAGDEGAGEEGA